MSRGFLLDTNVISAVMRPQPDPAILGRLDAHAGSCSLAAPIWHELRFGVERLPEGQRRSSLLSYLLQVVHAALPVVPYDERAAVWHAHERARLEKLGRTPPHVDGQIAAIAVCNDLTLVTANLRDFRGFTGLHATSWAARHPR